MASSSLQWEDKWSGLAKELLEQILKRLPVVDHIRFGAVCKTWLSVRIDATRLYARQPPWLLIGGLRQDNLDSRTRLTFKSSSEGETYKIDAPYLDSNVRWECIGVSYGWLIITSRDHEYFNLLNPISNEFIELPSSAGYVRKAVLSSSPESGCCVVVMITSRSSDILSCQFGDAEWRVTNSFIKREDYYKDLAFYKGHVYILNSNYTIAVYSYDWQQQCLKRLDKAPNPVPGSYVSYYCRDFLVGMGDDLLLLRIRYWADPPDMNGLAVFKLHKDGTQWETVQSFGNATLFLEWLGSEYLSSDELVGTDYRMDTIYCVYRDRIRGFSMGEEKGRYIQRLPVPDGSSWYMPRLC